MKVQCGYCGAYISDTDEKCPNCGAVNDNLMRSAEGVPKTIEELKAFCAARNMPLEKMRFFIGIDFKEPKAFGIYKEGDGDFIVYKNKADGSRAVRYRGKDEAYAVNELYQKLKSEVLERKAADIKRNSYIPYGEQPQRLEKTQRNTRAKKEYNSFRITMIIVWCILLATVISARICAAMQPGRGYYIYDDTCYYYNTDSWYYYYDGDDRWHYAFAYQVDDELKRNYKDYYESDSYSYSYGASDFADSGYSMYGSSHDSSYDNDWNDSWDNSDDWSYNYDSWDYNDSDWDSDW